MLIEHISDHREDTEPISPRLPTNVEWRAWGARDPFYAASGAPPDGQKWTEAAFRALGASDWEDYFRRWSAYGLHTDGSCIEIGCGPGRVTGFIAGTFRFVEACDVSDEMLQTARNRTAASNVRWHLTNGTHLPVGDGSQCAVFSTHVFQHLPSPADTARYFRECIRVLRPGGSLMVHLQPVLFPHIFRPLAALYRSELAMYSRLTTLKAAVQRLRMRIGGEPYMHGQVVDLQKLLGDLAMMGLADVQVVGFAMRSNGDPHWCVMGRRPDTA